MPASSNTSITPASRSLEERCASSPLRIAGRVYPESTISFAMRARDIVRHVHGREGQVAVEHEHGTSAGCFVLGEFRLQRLAFRRVGVFTSEMMIRAAWWIRTYAPPPTLRAGWLPRRWSRKCRVRPPP